MPSGILAALCLAASVGTLAVQAQPFRALEQRLTPEYEGLVRTLRTFYSGASLRFNARGEPVSVGAPVPWTLGARIAVANLRVRPGKLEIGGTRLFLAYDHRQKELQPWVTTMNLRVDIALELKTSDESAVRSALNKIFLARDEKIEDVLPSYWRSFFTGQAPRRAQKAYRVKDGVSPPRLVARAHPEYSQFAREAGLQGTVVLWAVVNEQGETEDLRIVKPLGLGLDEAAIEAVRQWKFEPGRREGSPVPVATSIDVTFRKL